MNPDFWKGKKVFLTGHTGFKGGWCATWLKLLGADVTGYALNPTANPNLFEVANIAEGMHSQIGDVLDFFNLKKSLAKAQPEIVIHFAAQALVRESYTDPVTTYTTNVLGTLHLLEAVRQLGSHCVVLNVTSDKCYENQEWVWGYRENEPLGGLDPYSSSKACSELVTTAYRNSFFNSKNFEEHGVALASVRAGNVIGGGDWAKDRLIPDILRALAAGVKVSIRNPHAIRPWQHVLDPLQGYFTLAEKLFERGPEFAEAWNFGPSEAGAKTVAWVADHLHRFFGKESAWKPDTKPHPHEANYLKLECEKARSRLGWQPQLSLDLALLWVAEWSQAQASGKNMRAFTETQIRQFMCRNELLPKTSGPLLKVENVSCL